MSRQEIHRALYGRGRKGEPGPEANIQKACMDWLGTLPNVRVWRHNVGGLPYIKADGKRGIVRFGTPGESDVLGICHGYFLSIEIKAPGKHPKPEQLAWLGFIRENGGIAFWVDSLKVCVDQLRFEFQRREWEWRQSWEAW